MCMQSQYISIHVTLICVLRTWPWTSVERWPIMGPVPVPLVLNESLRGAARMTGDMWSALGQSLSHNPSTTNPTRILLEINTDLLSAKPASNSPNALRCGKMLFTFIGSSLSLKQILVFGAKLAVVKGVMKFKYGVYEFRQDKCYSFQTFYSCILTFRSLLHRA